MLALTGAIPALVVMWIFDHMDRHRPEPRWTLRKVAFAGAVLTIPVIFIHLLHGFQMDGGYLDAAISGFIIAGLTEEVAKFLCVYFIVWHAPEFDERMDGITYGVRAGLGFAMVENVLYLHEALAKGQFIATFIGRALLAVPGHAIWAGLIGYFAARKRFDNRGPGIIGGLAFAIFLHGIYDFAIFARLALLEDIGESAVFVVFGVPIAVIVLGAVYIRHLAKRAIADDQRAAALACHAPAPTPPPGVHPR